MSESVKTIFSRLDSAFRHHYKLSESGYTTLWDTANIVLDTNVLLDLYRVNTSSVDDILNTLEKFSDRLFIPRQVAIEFFRNRVGIIAKQNAALQDIERQLTQYRNNVHAIEALQRHSYIDPNKINILLEEHSKAMNEYLANCKQEYSNPLHNDSILRRVTDIIGERVGQGFTETELNAIRDEGKKRYEHKIPPGFKDAAKSKVNEVGVEESDPYGDLIIWKEIIAFAQNSRKPIIYVTRDRKDDWFLKVHGETISPLPALVEEMWRETSVQFYAYDTPRFLELAKKRFNTPASEDTLQEIRSLPVITDNITLTDNYIPMLIHRWRPNSDFVAEAEKYDASVHLDNLAKVSLALNNQSYSVTFRNHLLIKFSEIASMQDETLQAQAFERFPLIEARALSQSLESILLNSINNQDMETYRWVSPFIRVLRGAISKINTREHLQLRVANLTNKINEVRVSQAKVSQRTKRNAGGIDENSK